MAFPFEQRPTLQEYLDWASKNGCKYGTGPDPSGLTVIRILGLDGRFMYSVIPLDERLSPTAVSNLDRRLGVDSPFSGAPEQS